MPIPSTDIKILWARAAGLCSMPDCRKKLTPSSETVAAGAVVIGENCHIVAESPSGPRGETPIPESERNRYGNLILLCANHHKIIDTNVSHWTVEKLKKVKEDHEIWIQTSLEKPENDPSQRIYEYVVTQISEDLLLKYWDGISDHAIRHLAHVKLIEGCYRANVLHARTNWPGNIPALEFAISDLVSRAYSYAEHYMSLAWQPNDEVPYYQEDRRWKKGFRTDYDILQEKSEVWRSENLRLLLNLTHAINLFADAVRIYIDPYFFLNPGRFAIHDSLGVTDMLNETWILPNRYSDNE